MQTAAMQIILMIESQLPGTIFSLEKQLSSGIVNDNKLYLLQHDKLNMSLWIMEQEKEYGFEDS